MGYFKRKLDRGRMRAFVRSLDERPVFARTWQPVADRPPSAPCFLRFSVRDRHPASLRRAGIFAASHRLLDRGDIDAHVASTLRDALRWFDTNLHTPDLDEERAIFLFRSDATECMRRMWDVVHALRSADVWVEMQSVRRPGRVVYEDELQIAVIPWTGVRAL